MARLQEYEQAGSSNPTSYTGSWARLFSKYDAVDGSDLVAFNTTFDSEKTRRRGITGERASTVNTWTHGAGRPSCLRFESRRLALELFSFLNTSSRRSPRGHAPDIRHGARCTTRLLMDRSRAGRRIRAWRPVFDDAARRRSPRLPLPSREIAASVRKTVESLFTTTPHPASSSHSGPPPDIFLPVVEEIR